MLDFFKVHPFFIKKYSAQVYSSKKAKQIYLFNQNSLTFPKKLRFTNQVHVY